MQSYRDRPRDNLMVQTVRRAVFKADLDAIDGLRIGIIASLARPVCHTVSAAWNLLNILDPTPSMSLRLLRLLNALT